MEQRTWSAIAIGVAVIVSTWIVAQAWTDTHPGVQKVNVTGMAETNFTSDLVVWRASFERTGATVGAVYPDLKRDAEIVRNYLLRKGIDQAEIVMGSIDIDKQYRSVRLPSGGYQQEFDGYRLWQSVTIESRNVDTVEAVSREISELLNAGVELSSRAPEYYYTKLSELKIDLLSRAAADGRERATALAENGGGSLGALDRADMGVFQITAQNSAEEYTWGGAFNTAAKHKTASITVRMQFSVK